MQRRSLTLVLPAALLAFAVTGCATKDYVRTETGTVNTRVDQVQGQVEQAQTKLNDHEQRIVAHDQRFAATDQKVGEISKTAQEALDRAELRVRQLVAADDEAGRLTVETFELDVE